MSLNCFQSTLLEGVVDVKNMKEAVGGWVSEGVGGVDLPSNREGDLNTVHVPS